MINGKKILAIIPARGGSKGVPGKNIKLLGGKPLIAWTIEAAQKSKYIDRLILSSDDAGIIEVAKQWGCEVPFVRPKELAQDDTPGISPVLHAIKTIPGYDLVLLLQVTSPLRNTDDIDSSLELFEKQKASSCVSVVEVRENPYWMYTMKEDKQLNAVMDSPNFTRRQDLPKIFIPNGAVYIAEKKWLLKNNSFLTKETLGFEMPEERSVDIDTLLDFHITEALLKSSGAL